MRSVLYVLCDSQTEIAAHVDWSSGNFQRELIATVPTAAAAAISNLKNIYVCSPSLDTKR